MRDVIDIAGNRVNLVKLRNPWGKFEWTGDWSDKSPLWPKNYSHVLDEDDGCFWMSF